MREQGKTNDLRLLTSQLLQPKATARSEKCQENNSKHSILCYLGVTYMNSAYFDSAPPWSLPLNPHANMVRGLQHSLRHQHVCKQQHWPQKYVWPWVLAADITMAPSHIRITDYTQGLGCSIDHRPQYGLSWMYRPLISTSVIPAAGSKGQGHHVGFRQCQRLHPLGSRASSEPGATAWITDTNMASWWHQRPQRSFEKIQTRDELFLVLRLHSCPEP